MVYLPYGKQRMSEEEEEARRLQDMEDEVLQDLEDELLQDSESEDPEYLQDSVDPRHLEDLEAVRHLQASEEAQRLQDLEDELLLDSVDPRDFQDLEAVRHLKTSEEARRLEDLEEAQQMQGLEEARPFQDLLLIVDLPRTEFSSTSSSSGQDYSASTPSVETFPVTDLDVAVSAEVVVETPIETTSMLKHQSKNEENCDEDEGTTEDESSDEDEQRVWTTDVESSDDEDEQMKGSTSEDESPDEDADKLRRQREAEKLDLKFQNQLELLEMQMQIEQKRQAELQSERHSEQQRQAGLQLQGKAGFQEDQAELLELQASRSQQLAELESNFHCNREFILTAIQNMDMETVFLLLSGNQFPADSMETEASFETSSPYDIVELETDITDPEPLNLTQDFQYLMLLNGNADYTEYTDNSCNAENSENGYNPGRADNFDYTGNAYNSRNQTANAGNAHNAGNAELVGNTDNIYNGYTEQPEFILVRCKYFDIDAAPDFSDFTPLSTSVPNATNTMESGADGIDIQFLVDKDSSILYAENIRNGHQVILKDLTTGHPLVMNGDFHWEHFGICLKVAMSFCRHMNALR